MIVDNKISFWMLSCGLLSSLALIANYIAWATFNPARLICITIIFILGIATLLPIYKLRFSWPILAIVFFSFCVVLAIGTTSWDPRLIWLFHAKRIYFDGSLYAQLDNYANAANDYPVIVPALSASIAKVLGFWNEAAPKCAGIFFLFAPLMVSLVALKNPFYFVIYLAGIFYLSGEHLLNGEMDAILAVYTSAIAFLLLELTQKKLSDSEGGNKKLLFATLALLIIIIPLIKNEGLVIILVFFICTLVTKPCKENIQMLTIFLVGIIFYGITWKIPLFLSGVSNDVAKENMIFTIFLRLQDFKNTELIALDFFQQSGISIAILLACLCLKHSLWQQYRLIFYFIFLYTLALYIVYLGTPYSLEWHLRTSSPRTLLPINVTALGCALYILKDNFETSLKIGDTFFQKSNLLIKIITLCLTCIILLVPIQVAYSKLDTPILFSKGSDGTQYLLEVAQSDKKGWSSPEEWGVWATGTPASFILPLPLYFNANQLNIKLRAYLPHSVKQQNVKILVNGEFVKSLSLISEYTYVEDLPIPGFWSRRGPMRISFEMERAIKPSQVGQTNDTRMLSIGLISASYKKLSFLDYLKSIGDIQSTIPNQ